MGEPESQQGRLGLGRSRPLHKLVSRVRKLTKTGWARGQGMDSEERRGDTGLQGTLST